MNATQALTSSRCSTPSDSRARKVSAVRFAEIQHVRALADLLSDLAQAHALDGVILALFFVGSMFHYLAFASRYSTSAWRSGSSIGSVNTTVWLRPGPVTEIVYVR